MSESAFLEGENLAPENEGDSRMDRTSEILEDQEAMDMLKESEKAIQDGRTKTLDELKEELNI